VSGAIKVEIFVDASCPYCHYGLATMRRLFDELAADPDAPALVPSWRFLRLYDLSPPEGLDRATYLAGGTRSAEQIAASNAALKASAAAVGMRIDETRYLFVSNPLLAHRLLVLARDDVGEDMTDLWALTAAIWAAKFSRGLDIADLDVLRDACEDAGLEVPERLWTRLSEPHDYLAETLADRAYAQSVNLDGVPRLRIDDTIIPAWLPLAEVRESLRAALLDTAATMT
jgi:predicted DsbA family dithiol-disulfide isomerase